MTSKNEKTRFLTDLYKTYHDVFDNFTENVLFKLIKQGYLDGLESPVAMGKEANVFSAKRGDGHVIVKIYRLSTCDFNRMYGYIKADPRFSNLKHDKREIIFAWARREYQNLLNLHKQGIRCPTPYAFMKNVVVMEYIGDEEGFAPKVKDHTPENPAEFFTEVIAMIKKMYSFGLVHGDLSSYNILNWEEKPMFIDVSQATTLENPQANEYLKRDI